MGRKNLSQSAQKTAHNWKIRAKESNLNFFPGKTRKCLCNTVSTFLLYNGENRRIFTFLSLERSHPFPPLKPLSFSQSGSKEEERIGGGEESKWISWLGNLVPGWAFPTSKTEREEKWKPERREKSSFFPLFFLFLLLFLFFFGGKRGTRWIVKNFLTRRKKLLWAEAKTSV